MGYIISRRSGTSTSLEMDSLPLENLELVMGFLSDPELQMVKQVDEYFFLLAANQCTQHMIDSYRTWIECLCMMANEDPRFMASAATIQAVAEIMEE